MDTLDIEKLKKQHFVLVKDMDSELVIDYLYSAAILNDHHVKEIREHQDSKKKNRQLLDTLKTRGTEAFCKFLEALQQTNQHNLVKLLGEHDKLDKICEKSMRSAMDAQFLNTAQQSLKDVYLTRFQKVYPFSLPFTFDIENTWVSLALKEGNKGLQETEDHAKLLERAFNKVKMLIIEGNPATGKTSLMRRLAHDWARGKQELLHYDLVLYAEFREVHEKTFQSIADLVLGGLEKYLTKEIYENLKRQVNNEQFCERYHILVLLDGYDESSLDRQSLELKTYLFEHTTKKALVHNVVITTRKGYLSNLRGREGRFIFAEVLGFITKQQKEKYIDNHFLSSEIDKKHSIRAVRHLLDNNENLNKLAETPLFLTFICLIHERIGDGSLLELYCSIIWWLIDRHQQDFPDRDIPYSFGFQNGSLDKFKTIQDYYAHFPQLHCLGKMALTKLNQNVFGESDYEQFRLKPIIEQVGLMRKQEIRNESLQLKTSFFFPHRTIQEFLAAFYCFCSNDLSSEWAPPDFKLNTSSMKEFEKFLLRIALSSIEPMHTGKRKYYFERIADIELDISFDALNTTAGFNNKLLNWFLSQCKNVQNITLSELKNVRNARHMNGISTRNESNVISKMPSLTMLSFNDLMKLHSLTLQKCTFEANSQLSFEKCPNLKNLKFSGCKMESSTNLGITILPAIGSVEFYECTFEINSQLSFTNCPSLKNLKFKDCEVNSSTLIDIAALSAIDTVEFKHCKIDLATYKSITDALTNSAIKSMKLEFRDNSNKELLNHLQKYNVRFIPHLDYSIYEIKKKKKQRCQIL